MKSKIIVTLLLVTVYLLPPAAVAKVPGPVDEDEPLNSTTRQESPGAIDATRDYFSNWNRPQRGGLFEMPFIGRLDSFGIRYASARSNFQGLSQQALFADFRTPWAWATWRETTTSLRLSFEAGRFVRDTRDRFFASLGPAVRITSNRLKAPIFLDVGLLPTIIGGSKYGTEDLGTTFNFTSHIGIGMRFGPRQRHEVKLRYQHISNGGINGTNPGVNMIGLDFVFWRRGR